LIIATYTKSKKGSGMGDRTKKLRETAFEITLWTPLTDSIVDEFLSMPMEYSEEEQKQMYARYVEKALKKLHPKRIVRLAEQWPLGHWLKATRSSGHLTREDIADTIGQSASYIMQIETEQILPWEIPSDEAAKLAILFRVHIDALGEMVYASYAVREARKKLPSDLSSLGLNTETIGPSVDLAIDLYYARNSPPVNALPQIEKWLNEVRDAMKKEARARKIQQNMRKS
jgi:transcriptional regulator with XRE-family HTH domain